MFDRAIFRRSEQSVNSHIDIGQLAETLLYYSNVDLLLDRSNFAHLLREIGPDSLTRLIRMPGVNAIFVSDDLATRTNSNGLLTHSFIAFTLAGPPKGPRFKTKEERVQEIFERALGSGFDTKRKARFASQFLTEESFGKGLAGSKIIGDATKDLFEGSFLTDAARIFIEERIPSVTLPKYFVMRPIEFKGEVVIDTDLDIEKLSLEYRRFWPTDHSSFSIAAILSEVIQARAGLGLSSRFGGDLLTTSVGSRIMEARLQSASIATGSQRQQMGDFSEWVLQGRSISGALHSGDRNFDQFLDLLENAGNFRRWVAGVDDSESLAKEYIRDITSKGWMERLPAKALRYMAFSAAGIGLGAALSPLSGVITGIAVSAFDAFLLDRLASGWKPNHFVENRVKPFVKP